MATAAAYIINIPQHRRELILDRADENEHVASSPAAEPVPRFAHSSRAALVVLASFEDGKLTHIADGRKGASAGTGLVRLNMERLQRLRKPITYEALIGMVPGRFRGPLKRALELDGLLPPKTLAEVVDALTQFDVSIAPRLARFSERRAHALRRLSVAQARNLAGQKKALGLALDIAGLPRSEVLAWSPPDGPPKSFLEGLPGARVREDAMLMRDFTTVPGYRALEGASHVASITFESADNPVQKLTVILANRLPLEEQTGADLIYYNDYYRSFVLVQYKAMENGEKGPEFRWKEGDQFTDEIARMDAIFCELAKCPADNAPHGFRLCSNPFFLKFCSRMVFNPDEKGLFPGIYLPLELWKSLHASGCLKGPRKGNLISYENVGRRLNNTEFVTLVASSWIGTTIPQSAELERVISAVLESGRAVTFAVKHGPKTDGGDAPDVKVHQ